MWKLNWNKERWRTRDRLLEYDFSIAPPIPHSAGLKIIYPWEQNSLSVFSEQLYQIAQKYGFLGSFSDFFNKFGEVGGDIVVGTLNTFPVPGQENNLYLDKETEILYYFKSTTQIINEELIARVGAAIVGKKLVGEIEKEEITYLYIPVRSLMIEDTILDSGDAAEYID